MPTDVPGPAFDRGLLSPVTAGHDAEIDDAALLRALVAAEVALTRAWAEVGTAPGAVADAVSLAFGWRVGDPLAVSGAFFEQDRVAALASAAVSGGNPVIPLVGMLRELVPEEAKPWLHRGATSQDILDTALVLLMREAGATLLELLSAADETLVGLAATHRDRLAAARTLTQHAVPTTFGLRFANWERGLARAMDRLDDALWQLPAQLGGAGGTLAAFAAIGGAAAVALPAAYAGELGLSVPEAPWHTQRWPVTELGDALAQALDALGVIAADVATLSRTEIGELAEGAAGGSSAMPQKRNPARSVLIRSAALRAPHLAATLHTAAALAVDERPDGAWHAEWPTLRELMRLALGAAAHTAELLAGLRIDADAVARNLGFTDGLIVAERLAIVLTPVLGADRVREIVAAASGGAAGLAESLRAEPAIAAAGIDVGALLDPARYTGLAGELVDRVTAPLADAAPPTGSDPHAAQDRGAHADPIADAAQEPR